MSGAANQHGSPLAAPLNGVQLIEASAGTGKTWTISSLFVRLLLERELGVNQILVVTFTNAATAELKDRIRARIVEVQKLLERLLQEAEQGEATAEPVDPNDPLIAFLLTERADSQAEDVRRLTTALYGFDEVAIATIHSFSQRLLAEHAFNAGTPFEAELIEDEAELIEELVDDYWRKHVASWPAVISQYLIRSHGGGAGPSQLSAGLRPWVNRRRVALPAIAQPSEAALQELQRCLQQFWQHWDNADDAKAYWVTGKDLGHRSLSKAAFAKLDRALSSLRAATGLPDSIPDNLERLTRDYLYTHLKDGKDLKEFPLWAAAEDLLSAIEGYQQWQSDWLQSIRADLLAHLQEALPDYKRDRGLRSYDDFLNDLDDALSGDSAADLIAAVSQQYPAVLVDEFQDTDSVQFDNFRRLFAGSGMPAIGEEGDAQSNALFLVGDPKQAIYGFRGADVHAYLEARKSATGTHSLTTNWRSTAAMVTAVNSVFSARADAFVLDGIDYQAVNAAPSDPDPLVLPSEFGEAALTVWQIPTETNTKGEITPLKQKTAEDHVWPACAGVISQLLQAGAEGRANIGDAPLQAADIAVLVRGHKQAAAMQSALRDCGVYSLRQDRSSVWHSEEAHQLRRMLIAMAQPQRVPLLRAALATRFLGLNTADLEALKGDAQAWDTWLMAFRQAQLDWQSRGLASAWRGLANRYHIAQRLLVENDGQRQLTNLNQLIELLVAKDAELRDPLQLLDYLTAQMLSLSEAGEAAQLRLESDAALVRIVTIHLSKGLEYPLVFCPASFAKIQQPKPDKLISWHTDEGQCLGFAGQLSESELDQYRQEQLAEDVRLQYVALTRAKYRCWLGWGLLDIGEQEAALAWLLANKGGAADGMGGWQALATEQPCAIAIQPLPEFEAAPQLASEIVPLELQARVAQRHIRQSWRVTSFTGLAHSHASNTMPVAGNVEVESETPDHDQTIPKPTALEANLLEEAGRLNAQTTAEVTPPEVTVASDAPQMDLFAEPEPEAPTIDYPEFSFHTFPRGAQAGLFMHRVLENVTLNSASAEQIETEVREGLEAYSFAPQPWLPIVCSSMRSILDTPLPAAGCALSGLADGAWQAEMEFHYPLQQFSARDFVGLLKQHQFGAGTALAERVERLDFGIVSGFMKGFIDLVFEANGRYFLADYKSNWLGPDTSFYSQENLNTAVAEADYWLQYLIYSVALHRYLQQRLPSYSYTQNFGGAYYLFLRGMGAGSNGLYFDRPSEALIEELSAMLAGGT